MKKYFTSSWIYRILPHKSVPALAVALISFFAGMHPASAQTLGDMFCNASANMGNLGDLFFACAYIAGAGFMGYGLYELVRHHDNPRERPIHHPLAKISGGAALLAAPCVAQTLINTFFMTPGTAGSVTCNVGAPTATSSGNVGLDVLIENLVNNIKDPFVFALSVLGISIGVFMVVRGLLKASRYNTDPRAYSLTSILSNLTVGTILIVVGQTLDSLLTTLFGTDTVTPSSSVAGWTFVTTLQAGQQFTNAIEAALMFFQLIGLLAFIRGWLILKSASEGSGQASMAQGITHVLGGVLALNIFNFLEIMDSTFGTGFL